MSPQQHFYIWICLKFTIQFHKSGKKRQVLKLLTEGETESLHHTHLQSCPTLTSLPGKRKQHCFHLGWKYYLRPRLFHQELKCVGLRWMSTLSRSSLWSQCIHFNLQVADKVSLSNLWATWVHMTVHVNFHMKYQWFICSDKFSLSLISSSLFYKLGRIKKWAHKRER